MDLYHLLHLYVFLLVNAPDFISAGGDITQHLHAIASVTASHCFFRQQLHLIESLHVTTPHFISSSKCASM
jgi:hypothetical protein